LILQSDFVFKQCTYRSQSRIEGLLRNVLIAMAARTKPQATTAKFHINFCLTDSRYGPT